jgi:hypothetical protein
MVTMTTIGYFNILLCSKGKVNPITGHEGPEVELLYRSTLSLASALEVVSGQRQSPGPLHHGKETSLC